MTAQNIKDLRASLGLTQKSLAKALKCDLQTVSSWEQGTRHPGKRLLKRLNKLQEVKK